MAAAATSDFARALGSRAAPASDERLCVGGALLATYSLGFAEACMHVERRPVPLRLALAFAAVNVVPSAVWSSVSARHVALAVGVPETRLVLPSAWPPALPPAVVARRVLALRTVRALRYVTGSYGLVWSVWRACSAESEAAAADGVTPTTGEERVVRAAPVGSALSRASKARHGDHVSVVAAPRQRWQRSRGPADWAAFGIHWREDVDNGVEGIDGGRVLLVEAEIGDETSAEHARHVMNAAKGMREAAGTARTVGVFSPALAVPFARELLDVGFNPLSAVLKALRDHLTAAGCARVVILPVDDFGADEPASDRPRPSGVRVRAQDVARGLLFQYGVLATASSLDTVDTLLASSVDDVLVVVMAENPSSALASSKKLAADGIIDDRKVHFIVNESLLGKVGFAFSPKLSTDRDDGNVDGGADNQDNAQQEAPRWLSIADVCDATLQAVRELFRGGMDAPDIQAAIYRSFGPQWASGARPDALSDIGRYI